MPPESGGEYHMARIRGGDVAAIGPMPEGMPPVPTWNTYVAVASADESAEKVRAAGGAVYQGPFDVGPAGRMAVVADPEGAVFCLWEAKANIGANVVNENGALNFNGLATRDAQAAEAFYRDVFGWKLLSIPAGKFWMLPVYGDHLEETTPGLRGQMKEMGAPDGFIDVVAAVNPIGDDDTRPHWSVTFGADDIDATAQRVAELGGTVVVAPHDEPWTKTATFRDPQGAMFLAAQFVAENSGLTA
jgi:predicted enzyme related to lactoylglutathione lyase